MREESAKEIVLERTGKRPLRFRGHSIWRWQSSPDRARSNFSGETGRWTVLELYLTEGAGSYVLYEARCTAWQGERDVLTTHVFQLPEQVLDWLEAHCPQAVQDFCDAFELYEDLEE